MPLTCIPKLRLARDETHTMHGTAATWPLQKAQSHPVIARQTCPPGSIGPPKGIEVMDFVLKHVFSFNRCSFKVI